MTNTDLDLVEQTSFGREESDYQAYLNDVDVPKDAFLIQDANTPLRKMIKTPKKFLQRGGSSLLFDNAAASSLKLKSQEASEFNMKEQNDDQALMRV